MAGPAKVTYSRGLNSQTLVPQGTQEKAAVIDQTQCWRLVNAKAKLVRKMPWFRNHFQYRCNAITLDVLSRHVPHRCKQTFVITAGDGEQHWTFD